jgi:heme/copper-type cytochrome/quinol oxidase subunit 2
MRLIAIKKEWLIAALFIVILSSLALYYFAAGRAMDTETVMGNPKQFTIHMVTGELKSNVDGKEIEAYRWDPGTIIIPKGKQVALSIRGINGMEHPFYIEGTNITGNVKKGKETVIHFTMKKEGIYRLICNSHIDAAHNGPMIAYLVVK